MNEQFLAALQAENLPVSLDESLGRHTTFRIGGNADFFCVPATVTQLTRILELCRQYQVRTYLLGNGSNTLFSDAGFGGAVICLTGLNSRFSMQAQPDGSTKVLAPAGMMLSALCNTAQKESLAGLEFAFGIPGTVGGAVAMNAGSFGTSTAESLDSVEIWSGGRLVRLTPDACETGYRHFRPRGLAGSFLVVSAVFRLSRSTSQDVAAGMQHNFQMKKSRQPITARSAGCVFRNPACGVSAGALLERAGFRGRRKGSVALSEQHANFLVNLGGGTSAEALALLEEARTAVRAMAGVELDFEVRFLPCLSS